MDQFIINKDGTVSVSVVIPARVLQGKQYLTQLQGQMKSLQEQLDCVQKSIEQLNEAGIK